MPYGIVLVRVRVRVRVRGRSWLYERQEAPSYCKFAPGCAVCYGLATSFEARRGKAQTQPIPAELQARSLIVPPFRRCRCACAYFMLRPCPCKTEKVSGKRVTDFEDPQAPSPKPALRGAKPQNLSNKATCHTQNTQKLWLIVIIPSDKKKRPPPPARGGAPPRLWQPRRWQPNLRRRSHGPNPFRRAGRGPHPEQRSSAVFFNLPGLRLPRLLLYGGPDGGPHPRTHRLLAKAPPDDPLARRQ